MEKLRLQKYLSECGLMSRRAAEREIEAGHFTVNGTVASLGEKVDPDTDEILYKGKPIRKTSQNDRKITVILHKPVGYVTTLRDEQHRPCVAELLKDVPARVYPVGRLDMYSEGLLICTNDGELANALMHPSHDIAKTYLLTVKGSLTKEDVQKLTQPMTLDGYKLRPVEAEFVDIGQKDGSAVTKIKVTLHEGRNRQIRRMCEIVGFTVVRLKRIAEGKVKLGTLPCGKWRYMTEEELSSLQNAVRRTESETEKEEC